MTLRRVLITIAAVLIALIVQLTILARLPLPGATPDLLLVVVVALAFLRGPMAGVVIGFAAGFALDLAPPTGSPIGMFALLFAVVGYAAAVVGAQQERGPLLTLTVVSVAGVGVVFGRLALGGLFGDARVEWADAPGLMVSEAGYAALLAVFVVPALAWLDRRVDPDPSVRRRRR